MWTVNQKLMDGAGINLGTKSEKICVIWAVRTRACPTFLEV